MLRLKQRSGIWYIRGTFQGRRVYHSTKTGDKAAARSLKTELERQIARSGGAEYSQATFRSAAELYLTYRPRNKVDRNAIARLVSMLGDVRLADIKQHQLIEIANAIYPTAEPSTKNKMVLGLAGAILHYAADNGLCPWMRIKKFKEKRPEPRWMHPADAEQMIEAARPEIKRLLVFLFCQGWRISDALRLQWEHIDFERKTIRYHMRKLDEWRVMPLHEAVAVALGEVREAAGRVFAWSDKANLYRALKPFRKAVGIHFTPHMARHSFATWLCNDGATLVDVMEAGGWRDHKSVLRYARINQARVRDVINRIKA